MKRNNSRLSWSKPLEKTFTAVRFRSILVEFVYKVEESRDSNVLQGLLETEA